MAHEHEWHEIPTGSINGINKSFTFSFSFTADTVEVQLNGLQQIKDTDYVEVAGLPGITMMEAPTTDDILWVHYIKA